MAAPFRSTPQRQAILDEVRAFGTHPTAAEIFQRVKQKHPKIAYGTVYKTLNLLAEQGDILEITFGDAASRFDRRTDRHDHAICDRCGMLVDLNVSLPEAAQRNAQEQASTHGFTIVTYHTEFHGLCANCQALGIMN